ncbi:hypothetical protein BON23_3953 [Saccharomyces cerevisiae]|nr:hypothetical protein BON23_3953 [Saccharomyces cerevisiae]
MEELSYDHDLTHILLQIGFMLHMTNQKQQQQHDNNDQQQQPQPQPIQTKPGARPHNRLSE